MSSIRLVLLSLMVGIVIGAGLMAARTGRMSIEHAADSSSRVRPADATGKISGTGRETRSASDDGYKRVANALFSIDERLSLMEAREESNLEKQNKLIDQVRELAIALEIKSGNLEPLRQNRSARLEPVRGRPRTEPEITGRAVPLALPQEPRVPLGGEELPEW